MKYLVLLTVALFAFASAQERNYPIFDRPCSERSSVVRPQVKTSFNVAAYSGTWFEVERYQQRDEPEADCLTSAYTWRFISREFSISRAGLLIDSDEQFSRQATAVLAFPDVNPTLGLLNVTYYADREADETNYYVLATDYFQYAVGWGCEDLEDNQSREFAWILSRTPQLPEAYLERIEDYKERFFDTEFFRSTVQDEAICLVQAPEIPETTEAPETESTVTQTTDGQQTESTEPESTVTELPETESPATESTETEVTETDGPETPVTESTDAPETDNPEETETEILVTGDPEMTVTEEPEPETSSLIEGKRFARRGRTV